MLRFWNLFFHRTYCTLFDALAYLGRAGRADDPWHRCAPLIFVKTCILTDNHFICNGGGSVSIIRERAKRGNRSSIFWRVTVMGLAQSRWEIDWGAEGCMIEGNTPNVWPFYWRPFYPKCRSPLFLNSGCATGKHCLFPSKQEFNVTSTLPRTPKFNIVY